MATRSGRIRRRLQREKEGARELLENPSSFFDISMPSHGYDSALDILSTCERVEISDGFGERSKFGGKEAVQWLDDMTDEGGYVADARYSSPRNRGLGPTIKIEMDVIYDVDVSVDGNVSDPYQHWSVDIEVQTVKIDGYDMKDCAALTQNISSP